MAGRGRPKGALNKRTAEVKEMASVYAPDVLAEMARLAKEAESEQARVAAGKEILDRAYGRAPQAVDANLTHNLSDDLRDLLSGSIGSGIPTPD